ncbi:MAG: protein kinase [Deltaproteobacteria bacterium]|nr:protein kinase [Deltaproteobacteria bacterium]
MNCPSCNSPLEHNARFCGVCGYRLPPVGQPKPNPQAAPGAPGGVARANVPPRGNAAAAPAMQPQAQGKPVAKQAPQGQAARAPKARPKGDEIYLNTVLNNRFKVESKIGEGGFGAVYRGSQLATGRKVALKLLHPEMTKDDNLVARFKREGEVLCKLRDAHTITTYDFDQTSDGTLYIAMELLEGRSLHQLFHEQAPLDWKRMFKILTEMCSSLAEAHALGIVHRDLKPENVYLEPRPGNPEFVKILDFGIAKVMRGDTIDPQSPQLTATGQTLGTLEYMSPEQLMGKALDGRSDVYALGVVAYEMITGRLPFPDAKGPAGLITAQLKQTPLPPSQANPKAALPPAADRAILKCLEKDKNNRFPDVSALSAALQDVINQASTELPAASSRPGARQPAPPELVETRRGEMPNLITPPVMQPPQPPRPAPMQMAPMGPPIGSPMGSPIGMGSPAPMPLAPNLPQHAPPPQQHMNGPAIPTPYPPMGMPGSGPVVQPHMMGSSPGQSMMQSAPGQPMMQSSPGQPMMQSSPGMMQSSPGQPMMHAHQSYPHAGGGTMRPATKSKTWILWVIGLLVFGAGAGALITYFAG